MKREKIYNYVKVFFIILLGTITIIGIVGADLTKTFWFLDSSSCAGCGRCANTCVLYKSAVTAVNHNELCPYRADCPAFYASLKDREDTSAINQRCPTHAITRKHIKDDLYEYTIDQSKCIGCGKCVRRCHKHCNGAMQLIINKDRCVECNECAISTGCPTNSISRKHIIIPEPIE